MPKLESALEDYWADEERTLRQRGIDPMDVPQIEPSKLATHPGSSTLHRTDHSNKSYKRYERGGII